MNIFATVVHIQNQRKGRSQPTAGILYSNPDSSPCTLTGDFYREVEVFKNPDFSTSTKIVTLAVVSRMTCDAICSVHLFQGTLCPDAAYIYDGRRVCYFRKRTQKGPIKFQCKTFQKCKTMESVDGPP